MLQALCAGLDRADILEDERWRNPVVRAANAVSLRAELVGIFRSRSADHCEQVLDIAGVPAARVRSLDEVLAESQAETRGFARLMNWSGAARDIHLPTLGFKVDSEVIAAREPPPELGQHTHAVLRELGYSEVELRHLADTAII